MAAIERGMANLARHLHNIRHVYGMPCVVALNRFPSDTEEEIARVISLVAAEGVLAFPSTHHADGGAGAEELAKGVLELLEEPSPYTFSFTYPAELSLVEKMETVAPDACTAPRGSPGTPRPSGGSSGSRRTATGTFRSAWPRRSTRSRPTSRWSARRPGTPSTFARCGSPPGPASW